MIRNMTSTKGRIRTTLVLMLTGWALLNALAPEEAVAQYSEAREVEQGPTYCDIVETPDDDDIIVVGTMLVGSDFYPWASRFDESGDKLWEKTYNVGTDGAFNKVISIGNDDYVAVGATTITDAGRDALVIMLDGDTTNDGAPIWQKTYGGDDYDEAFDIAEINGEYIVVGGSESFGLGSDSDFWLFRIDSDGDIVTVSSNSQEAWIGGTDDEVARAVVVVSESPEEYMVAGWSNSTSITSGGRDGYGIVMGSDFSIGPSANLTYGGSEDEAFYGAALSDGAVVLVGYEHGLGEDNSSDSDQDIWVVQLDGDYEIDWQMSYYSPGGIVSDVAYDVTVLGNGDLLVVGAIDPDTSTVTERDSTDVVLLSLDPTAGTANSPFPLFYDSEPGSENIDRGRGVAQATGGDLLVAALTDDGTTGLINDIWVLKLDANGEVDTNTCDFAGAGLEPDDTTESVQTRTVAGGSTAATVDENTDSETDRSATNVELCP